MKEKIETKEGYIIVGRNISSNPFKETSKVEMENGNIAEGKSICEYPLQDYP